MECVWCHRTGTQRFDQRRNTRTGQPYYTCSVRGACERRKIAYLKRTYPGWGEY